MAKRYDNEPKLNIKKVIATIAIVVLVIALVVIIINGPKVSKRGNTKNISNSYISIYENSKWGVINSKGEYVIKPEWNEMVLIPNDTQSVFIVQTDVNISENTYNSYAINEKGERQFTEYNKVDVLQNIKANGSSFIADNVLKVQKDGKYGLINLSGKELISPQFEELSCLQYVQNSYLTKKNGKYGLIDNAGNIIIENLYDSIKALTNKYEDGYVVEKEGKFGLINYHKEQVLETKYNKILPLTNGSLYIVNENGTYKLVGTNGDLKLSSEKLQHATYVGSDTVIINQDGKYSLIYIDDQSSLMSDYQLIEYMFGNNYIAKKDGKVGIVDKGGNTIVEFSYTNISYLNSEGFIEAEKEDGQYDLLDTNFSVKTSGIVSEINSKLGYIKVRVGEEYKYYNFKLEEKSNKDLFTTNNLFLSKKNGKYGFVDKNDVVIVDYIYDDATEQNSFGYAAVKKDGKWGCIDQDGAVVVKPSLELSQNVVVSFIGTWHLAPDINANYYTNNDE